MLPRYPCQVNESYRNQSHALCGCGVAACAAGALVADALAAFTGATIGLINAGAIGTGVPRGKMTEATAMDTLPYSSKARS